MILTVHVKPNAKETKILGWRDEGTVNISVKAAPVEGKANEAVIELLSDELKVPKSRINIKRGHSGRVKHVEIQGLSTRGSAQG